MMPLEAASLHACTSQFASSVHHERTRQKDSSIRCSSKQWVPKELVCDSAAASNIGSRTPPLQNIGCALLDESKQICRTQGQGQQSAPAGREEESKMDCLGAVDSMTLQMSRAEGRAEGSSWRQALMASSISAGHSSGTLHANAAQVRW